MNLYHKSKYENIVFVILLLICFLFMFGKFFSTLKCIKHFVYYMAYPSLSVASDIFKFSGNFADNIKSLIYLHQENISYKQKNQELTDQLRNYKSIIREYEDLLKLLKLDKINNTESIYTKITVREPSLWYQSFIIDKGLEDGLYNGLPAVVFSKTKNSLCAVGTIVETYKKSSKVSLITNSESVLPAEIKNKGVNCLVEGFNSNLVKVTYIPLSVDVKPGDELVVSNLSSFFNEGIPVGIIKNIVQEPYVDFQTANAEVYFDMGSSNIAIILVPMEQKQ